MTDGGEVPPAAQLVFVDLAATSGLDFRHDNGMSGAHYMVEMMGAGAALFDYDLDGDLDAFLLQGHPLAQPGANSADIGDRLFRNDLSPGSDGRRAELAFVDVTEASGIRASGYAMGVAVADYDNDGWPDIYITNWGPNQLWRNQGDGSFREVTTTAGVGDDRWSVGAAFLDFDRDGWLDLYVANYINYRLESDQPCFSPRSGRRDYCGPQTYPPEHDRLYRNLGDGRFEDLSLAAGIAGQHAAGLGVTVADFDRDGWTDVYVANDGMENALWLNRAGARFEDAALLSGSAVNGMGQAEASMGLVAADFDEDGDEDLFMTHNLEETNTYFENVGSPAGQGPTFVDRSRESQLGAASIGYTGFGAGSLDFDLDGSRDLLVVNGAVIEIDGQETKGWQPPLRQPGQLFRNLGDGRFEDWSDIAGKALSEATVGRGAAFGDVDADGDTDVLVTTNNGNARLLINQMQTGNAWIGFAWASGSPGGEVQGAELELILPGGSTRTARFESAGSYGSASDPRIRFGLGPSESAPARVAARVHWPDGQIESWSELETGRYHALARGASQRASRP